MRRRPQVSGSKNPLASEGASTKFGYNHFPELSELLPACAAHYATLHPAPEFDSVFALEDPAERARVGLARLYAFYRETEPMFGKLFSDRASVPELDRFMQQDVDPMPAALADGLAAGFALRGRRAERLKALIRLAVDFWTWRRLSRDGLNDEAAADLMAAAIAAQA
jgi:hypothetical protein